MRERRPYLYSDSKKTRSFSLTKEVLSHHLDTLTHQKGETEFENFALALAQKFISPNIRPQTGPTGGGDGKTDAENFQVSQDIALRWYTTDLAAATERWAFAFSAKKKWRDKVRSDVREIVGTGRGYQMIFFITNQFAPSRKSAEVQDALVEEHGVPVTILDRTWILDHVFGRDSVDIAVDVLGVGTAEEVDAPGPEDRRRLAELAALERDIADGTKYVDAPHALIEDCAAAAVLARSVEKPREDVDGRFMRAVRLARQHEFPKLELAAVYQWAWTSFFWFDDPAALNTQYDDVQSLALQSDAADDLERLTNLIPLLRKSVAAGALKPEDAKLEQRCATLKAALSVLRADAVRPNNALHAHALVLIVELTERAYVREISEDLDSVWDEFREVIEKSDGLGTFPFESIADLLTQLGEVIPESAAFDRLYEVLTDKLSVRKSEGEAAERNSTRGFQKLQKGLPYEAIRWFGRSVGLLIKEEYEVELIRALIGSSIAYQMAGLHWASRNYALAAASQQFSAFWRTGSIAEVNPATMTRLFESELKLGRIPYILFAYQLGAIVSQARATTPDRQEHLSKKRIDQSNWLATLLIKTPHAALSTISRFPDVLDRLSLHEARLPLLFLMGREDVLRAEGWLSPRVTQEEYLKYFESMAKFAQVHLAGIEPDYLTDVRAVLRSRVLGCEVVVSCANNLNSIAVGEGILGALESLLATSLDFRMLPHSDRLSLRVDPVDGAPLRPTLEFTEEDGATVGIVTHPPKFDFATREDAISFPEWLNDAVVDVLSHLATPSDIEDWAARVLGEENAFSRALLFSNVPNQTSLLHNDGTARLSIEDWQEVGDTAYEITRDIPWQPFFEEATEISHLKLGKGEPPEELFDTERLKHSDVRFVSPIDTPKWHEAKWRSVFFMTAPDVDYFPPVFSLGFLNKSVAAKLFRGLRSRYGEIDENNALRIAIIRGVWSSNPHAYAVVVGPNIELIPRDSTTLLKFGARVQVMTPTSTLNLDRFLAEYYRHGRFILACAHMPSPTESPEPMMDDALGKYHLAVRNAWEIGPNDPDAVVLDIDDPPLIPEGQPDAPALKTLEWLRAMQERKKGA